MGSTRADSAAVRDLSERLLTLELGSDISLAGLTGDFRRLFRLQGFVSYSLRIEHTRIEVDGGAVSAGVPDRWVAELDSVVRASGARFGYYDALRPQSWQRNRARTRTELDARVPMPTNLALAYARVGLADLDQLRVLVCEGDTLLAWVGGFREAFHCPGQETAHTSNTSTSPPAGRAAACCYRASDRGCPPSFVGRRTVRRFRARQDGAHLVRQPRRKGVAGEELRRHRRISASLCSPSSKNDGTGGRELRLDGTPCTGSGTPLSRTAATRP